MKGIAALLLLCITMAGCVAPLTITSHPEVATVDDAAIVIRLTPLKEGGNNFTLFRLEVTNLSDESLQIDWNKTAYIHDGKNFGKFVFEGINPQNVKGSIPSETIGTKSTLIKNIAPLALIARAPNRENPAGMKKNAISGGPLPRGENTLLLVISSQGVLSRHRVSVHIKEEEKG